MAGSGTDNFHEIYTAARALDTLGIVRKFQMEERNKTKRASSSLAGLISISALHLLSTEADSSAPATSLVLRELPA